MPDVVKIGEVKVETATVKLTKSLLKQFDRWNDSLADEGIRPFLRPKEGEQFNPAVLGYLHGSVLEAGEDYWFWILTRRDDGSYLLVRASRETAKKYAPRQLYIG